MTSLIQSVKALFDRKIHTLTLVSYKGTTSYPKELEHEEIAHFSTAWKAESYMRSLTFNEYPKCDFGKQRNTPENERQYFVMYALEESILNKPYGKGITRYYDLNGKMTGKNTMTAEPIIPFHGCNLETCRFKNGQIISFIYGKTLQCGIISSLPASIKRAKEINTWSPERDMQRKVFESYKRSRGGSLLDQTDDTYMILFDKDNHAHEQECNIIPMKGKIPEKQKTRLRRRYAACIRNLKI